MNIARYLERFRQETPDKLALVFEDERFSYRDLDRLVNQVAHGLEGLGVGAGDRVALMLPNVPAFIQGYCGILKIGAIAVSLNPMLKKDEAGFILADCGAKALITTAALAEMLAQAALPDLKHVLVIDEPAGDHRSFEHLLAAGPDDYVARTMEANDPAAIVYSSGTTGFPKGVTLSHGNIVSNMAAKKHHCGMRADDVMLLFVPLFHCFGQNAILNSGLNVGATIVLHRAFEREPVLRSVNEHQVTMFFGVSTIFILLLAWLKPQDVPSVRYFFSAAASLPKEISERWAATFGQFIYEGYGLTETSPFACYNHDVAYRAGSIGSPIQDVEMRIVDLDSGEPLGPGVPGEIAIRGPNVMLGYWNRPEDTARVIRDGWFHSGDIGIVDEDGYFYIVDRLKDMINVAGLKVYPAEVENVIYRHPAVAEVAVYGQPDPIIGERVVAQIVLRPGMTVPEREIFALCREHIAAYKVPSTIYFVASLPKNPTGKVLKRVLRQS